MTVTSGTRKSDLPKQNVSVYFVSEQKCMYLKAHGKSNNPFFIDTVRIPGTHYKISNTANRSKSGIIYDIVTDKL
jgi:hypothetical protein